MPNFAYRFRSFRGLIRKEARHVVRDRRTLVAIILMPIIQVLLFGYAIQTEIEEVRLAVVDPAPDTHTRAVRDRFDATSTFRVERILGSTRPLAEMFARGTVDQAIVFRPGFGERFRGSGGAAIQVITGTADPTTARSVESYARGVIDRYEGEFGRLGRGASVVAETRFRFNETLESQYLFVPGILAFVLTLVSALMTAITLAREKETGSLEALLASPLRSTDIILGKVLPYVVLAFLNAVTTLVVAYTVFGVPIRGSLVLLLAQSLLFVLVCLALGILIATRAPDQRTTLVAVVLITMLPTAVFSGMIFPVASMPAWLQPLTHLVPAKWFLRIVRGIMLRDAGLGILWRETAVLGGMAVFFLTVSIRSFSERLE